MQGKEFVVFPCINKGITVLLEWFVGGKEGLLFALSFVFLALVSFITLLFTEGPTVDGKLGLRGRNVAGVVLFLS